MANETERYGCGHRGLPYDPVVVLLDVAKHWMLILTVAILAAGCSFLAAKAGYTPVYETAATLVVTGGDSMEGAASGLSSSASLGRVFAELLNSSLMHRTILEEAEIRDFSGTISASMVSDTNLLELKVTAPDPQTALAVIQALLEHHERVTRQVVGSMTLELLQPPRLPEAPVNSVDAPGQMKRTGILTALGMAALCVWFSCTRNRVRSSGEARRKLDCLFLGELPHVSWHGPLLLSDSPHAREYAQAVRKLNRRVAAKMEGGKVLLVTSFLENEGKTTVAANLALDMARDRRRVLLIDCDLRKPECHRLLGQQSTGPGLRDVLTGRVSPAQAVVSCGGFGPDLLPEKKADVNSGDRLSSGQMQRLLRWSRDRYDVVILDLPPMDGLSDAEGLVDYADASLLVVRQNAAEVPDLNRAIAALRGGGARLTGCVLNNVRSSFLSEGRNISGKGRRQP